MSRESFIADLEHAADNIGDTPRHELAILLRRAALRLRNISDPAIDLDHEYQALIDEMNGDDPGSA